MDSCKIDFKYIFRSKAYLEGVEAGKKGLTEIDNPYSELATQDNLSRGMGLSPYWNTKYKPFIDWENGRND